MFLIFKFIYRYYLSTELWGSVSWAQWNTSFTQLSRKLPKQSRLWLRVCTAEFNCGCLAQHSENGREHGVCCWLRAGNGNDNDNADNADEEEEVEKWRHNMTMIMNQKRIDSHWRLDVPPINCSSRLYIALMITQMWWSRYVLFCSFLMVPVKIFPV